MDIIQSILLALADPFVKASASYNDLTKSSDGPHTPPYTISGLETVNFADLGAREKIVRIIFQNLSTYDQVLGCSTTWVHLLTAIENCLNPPAYVSDHTLNAKLSLLLVMTEMKASVIMSVFWVVADVFEIPPVVLGLLRCQRSAASFRNSTKPHYTAVYPIPSTVLVVCIATDRVSGWVCLNGCVAIHRSCTENLTEATRILALFNLLGHEMQHGIVRAAAENFNNHTPEQIRGRRTGLEKSFIDVIECCAWWRRFAREPTPPNIYEESESGCRWEREVWYGICPRWMDSYDAEAARVLAAKILNTFNTHGDIILSHDDIVALHQFVGSRSTCEGAMYYQDHVPRLF